MNILVPAVVIEDYLHVLSKFFTLIRAPDEVGILVQVTGKTIHPAELVK